MGRAKKLISKAKSQGGVPSRITGKQRAARKKNIVIARKSKKKGTAAAKKPARQLGFAALMEKKKKTGSTGNIWKGSNFTKSGVKLSRV